MLRGDGSPRALRRKPRGADESMSLGAARRAAGVAGAGSGDACGGGRARAEGVLARRVTGLTDEWRQRLTPALGLPAQAPAP